MFLCVALWAEHNCLESHDVRSKYWFLWCPESNYPCTGWILKARTVITLFTMQTQRFSLVQWYPAELRSCHERSVSNLCWSVGFQLNRLFWKEAWVSNFDRFTVSHPPPPTGHSFDKVTATTFLEMASVECRRLLNTAGVTLTPSQLLSTDLCLFF
jgi:hypothetical protein